MLKKPNKSVIERRRRAKLNTIRNRLRVEKLTLTRYEEADTAKSRGQAWVSKKIIEALDDIEADLLMSST